MEGPKGISSLIHTVGRTAIASRGLLNTISLGMVVRSSPSREQRRGCDVLKECQAPAADRHTEQPRREVEDEKMRGAFMYVSDS